MTIAPRRTSPRCVVGLLLLAAFVHLAQVPAWAQACPGLTLTKTDSPDPVVAGGNITYTINLSRPIQLLNATLTDVLPAGTTFVSLTGPAGVTLTTPAVGGTGSVNATFNYDPVRIYGITSANPNHLVTFAGNSPGTALSDVVVTGMQAGESLRAIDVRPATQGLYGIGSTNRLYLINPATGAATQVGTAGTFTLSGTSFGMDFNPVVDRIRVVSDTEQNLRLNPNDGTLAATDTALNPAGNVVAAAYTNNNAGVTTTTLYVIDSGTDQLKLLGSVNATPVSPNSGVLTVVGPLGVDTSAVAGFDISPTGRAWALLTVGGVSGLYTINPGTGAATLVGSLPSNLFTDIAVGPSAQLNYQFTLTVKTAASITPGSQVTNTVNVSSSSEVCTSSATAVTAVYPTPTLTLTPSVLNFGVINDSGTLTAITQPQILRLTQSVPGTVTWTVSSDVPWLSLLPGSGSGAANILVSITSNPALLPPTGAAAATITVTSAGATNSPTATVNLNVLTSPQATAPFGVIDTPIDGQGNVTGAIPVTGWAIDDVGVTRVRILRNPIAGEDPSQLIFIGDAVFVAGARPDVAAANPTAPLKDQAGWGYMLLTNALPSQGNGTFTLVAYADDAEGRTTLLGTRTIACTNASATDPFGTIDTPGQGATISGSSYANFGWALTPLPKTIPTDGSTIQVFIDSVPVGGLTSYNNPRSDIQALFPGYNNTDGAVGVRVLDTTAFANGVHTIAWGVTDNMGAAAGLGSRYFTVSNSGGGSIVSAPADGGSLVIGPATAMADNPPSLAAIAPGDVRQFRVVQLERLVIDVGEGARPGASYRGYEIDGDKLIALPVGSHLDADTGVFSWAPGLGFGGTHPLVFISRESGTERQFRADVSVVAQREVQDGARVVIDTPSAGAEVRRGFVVAGWAFDSAGAAAGTGIDVLHVWAHPVDGSAPRFVGVASYGGVRPDVAKAFGARFLRSGFGVDVAGLPAGTYDVVVYGLSQATGRFSVAGSVRVTVRSNP